MWVACRCGRRHFGLYGAAGLVLRDAEGRVLMTHRSEFVHFGGTWSFPGGALEVDETPVDAAVREVGEELDIPAAAIEVVTTLPGVDHGVWRYTYVISDLNPQWSDLRVELNWEATAVAWVAPAEMETMILHPDLRNDLEALHAVLARTARTAPRPRENVWDGTASDTHSP